MQAGNWFNKSSTDNLSKLDERFVQQFGHLVCKFLPNKLQTLILTAAT